MARPTPARMPTVPMTHHFSWPGAGRGRVGRDGIRRSWRFEPGRRDARGSERMADGSSLSHGSTGDAPTRAPGRIGTPDPAPQPTTLQTNREPRGRGHAFDGG